MQDKHFSKRKFSGRDNQNRPWRDVAECGCELALWRTGDTHYLHHDHSPPVAYVCVCWCGMQLETRPYQHLLARQRRHGSSMPLSLSLDTIMFIPQQQLRTNTKTIRPPKTTVTYYSLEESISRPWHRIAGMPRALFFLSEYHRDVIVVEVQKPFGSYTTG